MFLFKVIKHRIKGVFSFFQRVGLKLLSLFAFAINDKSYLKCLYRLHMGKPLNLSNPTTFNEKLNWLKLYDRQQSYTQLVDKYRVKDYVATVVGREYVIDTIGVWDRPDEIDWDSLPEQFVLKTTHGGGNVGVVICKDKSKLDKSKIVKKLNKSLKQNIYLYSREWVYKGIKPRIIAEPYMEDIKTGELLDYKFFCFDGEVKMLFVASARQKCLEPYFDFFDAEYNPLPIIQGHPNSDTRPAKPQRFDEMKAIASKLSKEIPTLRVDLYEVNGKVYFGELTFYHFGGLVPFVPEKWDYILGQYIHLDRRNNV